MADSSSKSAGSKGADPKPKVTRSDSEALIALAAKESAEAAEQPQQASAPPDPEGLTEQNRQSFEAFIQANAAVLDGMAALSAEMLAFGNKRLSANIERTQSLAGCEDIQQAFQVQSDFFESAVRHYLDQANNVMAIMASMGRSFWGPLEAETTAVLGETSQVSKTGKSA